MNRQNKLASAPIGIFDSGVGGLSVWTELIKLLPYEDIIYFADNKNCPYGSKPQEEIICFSNAITDFLLSNNCKIIVVACNTATAAAIEYLRKTYTDTSFVGMEPAIKPAALNSQTGSIGILATAGTLKGKLFNETKSRFASNVEVHVQVGDGLVELVEQGKIGTPESEALLRKYIEPMIANKIDHLVLGCTHYPFLADDIRKIAGNKLTIINPAPAVAQRVKQLLKEQYLLNQSTGIARYKFYTSGDVNTLNKMLDNLEIKGYNLESIQL